MFKKISLLLVTTIIFNTLMISNSFAHKEHQDMLLKNLQETINEIEGISNEGFNLIKNNIKSLNFETHYSNSDHKLEKDLSNIMKAATFDASKYNKTMEKIFKGKKEYKDTSTAIIAKLSQKDRIVLFKIMQKLNLNKHK